ncbi:MAG: hypothetical protein EZS28_026857 [Streblomastix strix]|uniref:Uncharacterized protein n=1 Tax=Streblomastix strix TaxID=222440 RepID=A0A5J4V4T7_9EUKA|nr:MAG: hypothetical protein EZS28_026857 [Streblomastix strix]
MKLTPQINTSIQDIGQLQTDVQVINQELSKQTHFRGYFTTIDEILALEFSAMGDYAYSAEDLLVWVYENNWIETDQLVPDQVTPASDVIPSNSIVNGSARVSTEYNRGDHQHPLQVSTVLPQQDTATGEVGDANTYARFDHTHHVNLSNDTPVKDPGTGTAGTDNVYASATHQYPLNVDPSRVNVPLVNATAAANGTSDYYCRNDHVHPQQLTYDGNITATKFIKTGGLPTEILCANGDTTTIDCKFSRTYNGSAGGWIRLCVFPSGASVGNPFIEFKLYSMYNAVQTIRLVPYYTVNGINTVHGIFTAPPRVSNSNNIENGVNQLFHNHSGSGTSVVYAAHVRLETAGSITIVVFDQSTYYTNRVTEILTQDVVSGVSNGTQIPITYDLANSGIINNMLQVNPTNRSYSTYNNGIRIGNYSNESALYLGCDTTVINTTKSSVGLSINSDSTIIKFNGNELVNVGTDQIITGKKLLARVKCDAIQISPTVNNFNEGIRISRSTISDYSGIQLGCDPNSTTGTISDQWSIVNTPTGELRIGVSDQLLQDNKGLMISADGNTLSFNGSVIDGTGASNGASNGQVNYSAGNPILWGLNSTDSNGGFFSSGSNICWRAHPLTQGSVPP